MVAPRTTASRRQAWRYGRRAEWLCLWYLRLKGYRILATNLRMTGGEVDIVARRGRVVAFIEVKARRTLDEAREAVRPRQQERVARAAQEFLAARPGLAGLDGRFDALLLAPGRSPRNWLFRRPVRVHDAWRIE